MKVSKTRYPFSLKKVHFEKYPSVVLILEKNWGCRYLGLESSKRSCSYPYFVTPDYCEDEIVSPPVALTRILHLVKLQKGVWLDMQYLCEQCSVCVHPVQLVRAAVSTTASPRVYVALNGHESESSGVTRPLSAGSSSVLSSIESSPITFLAKAYWSGNHCINFGNQENVK